MNKKWLLVPILVLTIIAIIIILVLNSNTKYNKLIISEEKWNDIISNRNMSTSISLENIKFNDYNLLIDEDNSIIYYSIVKLSNKFNPSIDYAINNGKIKIAINKKMSDEVLENTDSLKIMLYNDTSYRIYSLVATNYPILNVVYKEEQNEKRKIDVNIELFDNHVDSPQRVLKSDGKLRIVEENKEYSFSLIKESLGHNKRENHISVFGMEKRDEYTIRLANTMNENEKYVHFFINNKHIGVYSFGFKEGSVNNFERNKENNR